MYTNVAIPVVYKEKNVTLVVTEIYYVPEQKQNFNCEGELAQIRPEAGYAFVTETGDDLKMKEVLKSVPEEFIRKALLDYVLGDTV